MKKIIAIFAVLFALCSCEPESQKATYTEDGAKIYVREFEYNGHKYIEFARINLEVYDKYTGYVHDPDCPCHNEEEK